METLTFCTHPASDDAMPMTWLIRQYRGVPLITRLALITAAAEKMIGEDLGRSIHWMFSYCKLKEPSMTGKSVMIITLGVHHKRNLLPTSIICADQDGELYVGENIPLTLSVHDRLTRTTLFGEPAVFRLGHLLYAVLSPRKLPAETDASATATSE